MNGPKFYVLCSSSLTLSSFYSCSRVFSPNRKVLFELLFIHPRAFLHDYLQMKYTTVLPQIVTFFVRKRCMLSTSFQKIVQNTVYIAKKIQAIEERRGRGSLVLAATRRNFDDSSHQVRDLPVQQQ